MMKQNVVFVEIYIYIYKQGIFNSTIVTMAAFIVSCWRVDKIFNTHKHNCLLSNHRAAGLTDERKQLKGLFGDAANQKITFHISVDVIG